MTHDRPGLDRQAVAMHLLPSVPFASYRSLPNVAAVYFVLDETGAVLYIGRSLRLSHRWDRHEKADWCKARGATRIAWLLTEDRGLLEQIEEACIDYFNPPGNRVRRRHQFLTFPYKLQVWLPEDLRYQLKALAFEHHTSLQTVVTALLTVGVHGGTVDLTAAIATAVAQLETSKR